MQIYPERYSEFADVTLCDWAEGMAIFYVVNYRGNYACVAHMLRLMQTLLIAKKVTIISDDRLFIRFMIAYHALYHIWFSSYSHDVCDINLDRVIRSYHAVMLSVIPAGTKIEMNIERDDRLSLYMLMKPQYMLACRRFINT